MTETANVNERAFIKLYCELTECSEAHARSVYMHLALLRPSEAATIIQTKEVAAPTVE
jgi:hypothetical protein